MGIIYAQDASTGHLMHPGDPVVGFVVSVRPRRAGRQPEPQSSGVTPNEAYRLESLAIHGNYDGQGGLEVQRKDDLSVRLLLAMTGTSDWSEFASEYLVGNDDGGPRFALALLHADTFVHLLAQPARDMAGVPTTARAEMDQMLALHARLAKAQQELSRLPAGPDREATAARIAQIDGDCMLLTGPGMPNRPHAPKLAQVLQPNSFGPAFMSFVRQRQLHVLHRATDVAELPGSLPGGKSWAKGDLRDFLSQLWVAQVMLEALSQVLVELRPGSKVPEGVGEGSLTDLRLHGLETALVRGLVRAIRDDELSSLDAHQGLEKSLARVESMVARTRTLARAHLAKEQAEQRDTGLPRP
ncbi:hypothetical protein ACSFA0_26445 [Variovorax sp. LT1P1]|uniref:hypothetical protein n=1 Tax=Variovorax sp. LT1P1 TaxID=3443730 RepID=UPI003F454413